MTAPTTVLIVDDEPRSLEAIQRVLADEFEVICAANAAQAEEVLAGEMVQIILCDQRMPGESGVDFLKRVRESWPDTIRIIISGYSDSEDVIAGVNQAGIYQYVTKPWRPDDLLDIIREASRLSRMQHEATDIPVEIKPAGDRMRRVISDRPGDIPTIAARALLQINQTFGRQIPGFAPETLAAMTRYDWPGNVRELHNEIQRMVVLSERDAPLPAALLSDTVHGVEAATPATAAPAGPRLLKDLVAELEAAAIEAALRRHRDNISRAAEELGLSRVGLRGKIERYDLRRDGHDVED